MATLARVLRPVVMCGLSAVLGGCFLNATLSRVTVTSISEEVTQTIAAFQSSATVAVCADLSGSFPGLPINCTYIVDGTPIGSTTSFIRDFGVFGVIVDPVILQVPASATNLTGTFSGTSTSGNLVITPVAGTLDADLNTRITPEPGMRLVIIDFPDPPPLPSGAYGYNFSFQLPGNVNPVVVKALFAGKVQSGSRTFYPPMLPCETNFANIPAISLPQSAVFQNVNFAPLAGVQGCNNRTYVFAAAVPPPAAGIPVPTLQQWALALLAVLMVLAGSATMSRRR
jgi:hypothetical protein